MAYFIQPKLKIAPGDRYERLVVTEVIPRHVKCLCDCGTEHTVHRSDWGKKVKSCGCLRRESVTTHGMSDSPTYSTWESMIQRCTNPRCKDYADYGGRGITVCQRWRTFENFLADMGVKPEGRSIDRIDNDGSYEPGNCRWATLSEQNSNQRRQARQVLSVINPSAADGGYR
ncbi:hypothetical protein [Streptomyces mirabilis]|uniref:hypothetical protein n=1 Tax=Streptomyces mirabilis TaxID=68239 RepID=UPI0033BD7A5B